MCGIIGYLDKRGGHERPIGRILLDMLQALSCRGPDSTGVATFGAERSDWLLQVKLPEDVSAQGSAEVIVRALGHVTTVSGHEFNGAYLRVAVVEREGIDAACLEDCLVDSVPGTEVVSLGRQVEVVKQVGGPAFLHQVYDIAAMLGSHGIGHTRLSTESRVDLSHSQPFWAHGVPDLATVHNGHITNYHKLRRRYEQRGYRFFTENDSEIIGVYLRDRMAAGLSLTDALRSSLDDFDGSFSYLAASGDCLAYVKDRFGFKPLVVAETDAFVALATEEIALRQALGREFVAREPAPGTLRAWTVPQQLPQDKAALGSRTVP
jgi:glutamate synthase domain-containing protein 1